MPELLRRLHLGSKGGDVAQAQRRLTKNRHHKRYYHGPVNGIFDHATQVATIRAKWQLGFRKRNINGLYGTRLHSYLVPKGWKAYERRSPAYLARAAARKGRPIPANLLPAGSVPRGYPLAVRGEQIGYPYQGTHDHPSTSDPMHNWESCNAVDVATHEGTPVLAVRDGTIDPDRFGPLDSTNPVLLGIRLHVLTGDNDFYYAHLSATSISPGAHVKRGQLIGHSGVANGVAHLHLASEHGDPGLLIGNPTPGYSDRSYPS